MDWKTYTIHVLSTAKEMSASDVRLNCALGLVGEAGEVSELIKKDAYHSKPLDSDKLVKELGDVMYYFTWLCYNEGIDPEEVLEQNVKKLAARHPNGFSGEYKDEGR